MSAFDVARWGVNIAESEDRDDLSSAWAECVAKGEVWGGRAKGGRGIRLTSGYVKDVSIDRVTISFAGNELLSDTKLQLLQGHRYGLLGPNGVGKSTLLRRIARGSIPGFPVHMQIEYVQQEQPNIPGITVREFIFASRFGGSTNAGGKTRKESLEEEESELAELLAAGTCDEARAEEISERMCEIADQLEKLELGDHADDSISPQASSILAGLRLTTKKKNMLDEKLSRLSGGWRMRAALARALINLPNADILLLDEATNHLDMHCVGWLEEFLCDHCDHCILLMVSHDRQFLDSVSSDIIELKDRKLAYFAGNYSDWVLHEQEMAARLENRLDAQVRKEDHIKKSIEAAKSRGHDAAAKAKVKKLERVAMQKRSDGKRFQLFSLKKLSEEFLRLPEKIEAIRANRMLRFKFPDPDIVSLRLASPESPILTLSRCSVGWDSASPGLALQPGSGRPILTNITLQLTMKSRIAVVGPNGQGKSTLIAALKYALKGKTIFMESAPITRTSITTATKKKTMGLSGVTGKAAASRHQTSESMSIAPPAAAVNPTVANVNDLGSVAVGCESEINQDENSHVYIRGEVTRNHNIKTATVSQHHFDTLSDHLNLTAVEYIRLVSLVPDCFEIGSASKVVTAQEGSLSSGTNSNDTEIRAHLGMFGLGGDVALRTLGSLSGGQKARLAFAATCVSNPHVLFLDEPTNHLSIEGLEALAVACRDFQGSVICASHNRHFLSLVCNELCVVDKGLVDVRVATRDVQDISNSSTSGQQKAAAAASAALVHATGTSDGTFISLLTEYLDSSR